MRHEDRSHRGSYRRRSRKSAPAAAHSRSPLRRGNRHSRLLPALDRRSGRSSRSNARRIVSASSPMTSSISCRDIRPARALGRSILLMTGMISQIVVQRQYSSWPASAPQCPASASTTSSAPSHAASARDYFVGEVHMTGRVDQVEHVGLAVLGLIVQCAPPAT